MAEISDQDLLKLIVQADDEALQEGSEPKQRFTPVIEKVMKKLNFVGYIMMGANAHPMVQRISKIHSALYRPSDLAIGGIHGGIFMFRDVFARVSVPIIYGQMRIDPLSLVDLSPMQIKWLCSRPSDFQMYLDQFTDVFDFGGGIGNFSEYKPPPKEAMEIFWLAAFQLQAAAAALTVAFDFRGAIQSSIIGAELALKAGLAAAGHDEKGRRTHQHDLSSAAKAFDAAYPTFDLERVLAAVGRLPPYVKNRYSSTQPNRVQTGHIAMNAQFIAGEVMRQVTGYSLRNAEHSPSTRIYPPLAEQ